MNRKEPVYHLTPHIFTQMLKFGAKKIMTREKEINSINVFGIGLFIDCERVFVFDARRCTLVDSSLCRDCFQKINDLRGVDGLPPIENPDHGQCKENAD